MKEKEKQITHFKARRKERKRRKRKEQKIGEKGNEEEMEDENKEIEEYASKELILGIQKEEKKTRREEG